MTAPHAAPHAARRVLLVGNFGRKTLQRAWFNTESKLANGFIRLGDHVLTFSDRDAAREATPLRAQAFGARRMARDLVATAAHYRPHLALFGHCDMLRAQDFAALRAAAPGVRLAAFCVDAALRADTMAAFAARAACMDAAFITTGDAAAVAPFGFPKGRLYFMPNPVDAAVECARAFDAPRARLAWDGMFLGTGIGAREAQLADLRAALPPDFRFFDGGRAKTAGRLWSTRFLDTLATAAMAPNLPLDDGPDAPIHRLYSSDRIAQLLGQGVLALAPARSGLAALYDEGVVAWTSRAELAEAMARLMRDDAERRRIAGIGWRIAHARTSSAAVAAWIAAVTLGETPPPPAWPGVALT